MGKNPFNVQGMTDQAKGAKAVKAAKAAGEATLTSAQAIAKLNQATAQELTVRLHNIVTELTKNKDPKAAFEYAHAQVLQDAAKEVAQYQAKLFEALASGNQELTKIAETMIKESQHDLIHFVNEATQNAPAGTEPYTSIFKTSFNSTLQNFEMIRAGMADSFAHFEKSLQNMGDYSGIQKEGSAAKKSATKK
ncbi:phasin family protein [Polynucleobacter antarcticus]|uniref:Phasin domain-containing protein n=1 Tax=Polynucleobacter antarcticus TaxID=1743162 RepID=A0A6M9PQV9_9BURK|nr:phasin family protein [Polynucleobacter antarcticus]QKM62252.1 hypothetical protein DCO16_03665 [Polynucleobacter antarcticus]